MLASLADRREKLCKTFAKKCAENPLTADLFPKAKNIKNTRNPEKFIVTHCNTERFKTSAVPYLQRLLNKSS